MAEKKNLIRELIETGKRNGKLTTKEINDAIEESGFDVEQIDKLYETMESHGIEIADEPDNDAFTLTEDSVDEFENSLSAEGVAIDDPVKVYLKEIGRVPLLSSDEEVQLALDILAGSQAEDQKKEAFPDIWKIEKNIKLTEPQRKAQLEEARKSLTPEQIAHLDALDEVLRKGEKAKQRLSEANLRLVVSIAKRYVGRGMQFLDLIQEGNLGLIKAVEKFDHTKGFKFSTYATWWIRQAITRAIADQARTIRIPVHMVETINRMRQATSQLVYQNGHEPTAEELAKAMDMTVERVREIQRMAQEPASLESPVGEEEDSSLGDFVADENAEAPGKAADRAMVAQQINLALKSLTPREERVIRLRFGLDDGRPRTLEEVGRDFGVTRERVRQIEAKAIRKLHSRKCLTLLNGLIE